MREIADEVGATFMVDMAHFAGLVAGKVFTGDEDPVPHAHLVTTTTHKSLRGPRGGLVLATEEYAPTRRPRLPDGARRTARSRDGGQGGRPGRGPDAGLPDATRRRSPTTPRRWPRVLTQRGAKLVTGGTDNHLVLLDVTSFGLTGRQAESALLDAGIVTNRNAVPNDPNGAWYTSGVRIGTPALTTRGFGADEFDRVAELIVNVLQEHHPGDRLQRPAGQGQVHPGRRGRRRPPRPPRPSCWTSTRSTPDSSSRVDSSCPEPFEARACRRT